MPPDPLRSPTPVERALGDVTRWLAAERPGTSLNAAIVLAPGVAAPPDVEAALRSAFDAVDGDELTVHFDTLTLHARPHRVAADWRESLWPPMALRILTGEGEGDDLRARLGAAIGADADDAVTTLRARGDDDIADLVAGLG